MRAKSGEAERAAASRVGKNLFMGFIESVGAFFSSRFGKFEKVKKVKQTSAGIQRARKSEFDTGYGVFIIHFKKRGKP